MPDSEHFGSDMFRPIELGPLDIAALMDSLDRIHHRAVVECDDYEVWCAEWAAVNGEPECAG